MKINNWIFVVLLILTFMIGMGIGGIGKTGSNIAAYDTCMDGWKDAQNQSSYNLQKWNETFVWGSKNFDNWMDCDARIKECFAGWQGTIDKWRASLY